MNHNTAFQQILYGLLMVSVPLIVIIFIYIQLIKFKIEEEDDNIGQIERDNRERSNSQHSSKNPDVIH